MRNWLFILTVSGCILGMMLVLQSCGDTIPIGTDVLPEGDSPDNMFTDTNTIYSWTIREDTLRSDKLFLSPLGYMEDPIFGSTKSSLMMGFQIPTVSINGSLADTVGGYYLDSIVMALMISDIYGDTNLPMGFTLYKLPTPLDAGDIYYSNTSFPQGMVEVGRISSYNPSRFTQYDEDTILTELGVQMRVRLNPFFGQSLLNILNTDLIRSNTLFHQYLPGLVVIPDEMPGSTMEINLVTNTTSNVVRTALQNSRIQMYYKNSQDTSLSVIFPATTLNLGINKFEHDYSSTNVESALLSTPDEGDAVTYVQGLAGVKTMISFPYLDGYSESIAVIKAELVITQLDAGSEDIYEPAPRLLALRIGEDSENVNTSDFSTFPAGHFGGFGEEVVLESGETVYQYRINISDYIQRVIFGQEPNDGMYITVYPAQTTELSTINASDLTPHRVVIGGGNNTDVDYRMKLDLTYTVLD